MIDKFNNYLAKYDMNNYNINYRYKHSYRVKDLCETIAKRLDLNEEDTYIISVIGLLHDIGKFEQIKLTGDQQDRGFKHGDYGADLLFKQNLISKFQVDEKYYDIIEFAIRNHDKRKINKVSDSRKMFFAKFIRDIDKIDIIYALGTLKDYNILDADDEITEEVKNEFENLISIDYSFVKNKSDKVVLTLAYIFDINFKNSLKLISEKKLLDNFYNNLQDKNKFKYYFDVVNNYIKERI